MEKARSAGGAKRPESRLRYRRPAIAPATARAVATLGAVLAAAFIPAATPYTVSGRDRRCAPAPRPRVARDGDRRAEHGRVACGDDPGAPSRGGGRLL